MRKEKILQKRVDLKEVNNMKKLSAGKLVSVFSLL